MAEGGSLSFKLVLELCNYFKCHCRVIEIVSKELERDRTILVCSAISGCTDTLIEVGRRAAAGDESFQTLLDTLRERPRIAWQQRYAL